MAWFALAAWEWKVLNSTMVWWNFEELRVTSFPFSPPDLHTTLLCAPGGWLYGLHSKIFLPFGFQLDLDNGSHQQDMGGKKKSEIGVFTSLDSSLLGHCGMFISLAKTILLSGNLFHAVSPLGLVDVPLLATSDLEIVSLLLLLTPGAYTTPIPFLNDCKSFFVNLFLVTQLSMPLFLAGTLI